MKLFHGFDNFEKIISSNKLKSPSLSMIKSSPVLYIYPSLLFIAGEEHILPNEFFYIKELVNSYKQRILSFGEEHFHVSIPKSSIEAIGRIKLNSEPVLENSKEFYRNHSVFFSYNPLYSRDNFFVFNVPDSLILQSPQGFPVVAGEISLDYVVQLFVKKEQESFVKTTLSKYDKSLEVITYNFKIDDYEK